MSLSSVSAVCREGRRGTRGVEGDKLTSRLAVEHTKLVRELAEQYSQSHGTNFRYQYSPETFSQTETKYAVEVCEAVKKTWLGGQKSVWADGRTEERIIFVSIRLLRSGTWIGLPAAMHKWSVVKE